MAEILVPIHAALAGRKRLASLVWIPEMENAFTASKNALADATLLVHPVEDATTSLTVDASIVAIGGVLEQKNNGVWRPVGFFSRKLQTPRETKYSTYGHKLLAGHFAIRHFRYFLEGRHFTLYTDQDSLVPALRKSADSWTRRQHNQLSEISEYTTDVRHIAGKDNQVADALSRITIDAVELAQGVDFHVMALAQDSDDDIIHLRNDPATALRLENVGLNRVFNAPLFRRCSGVAFSMPSTDSRILEFARHDVFSHRSSSGLVSLQMPPPGRGLAFHANNLR